MKFGKKTTALLAFFIGTMIFATAALADTAIGSGYHSLKNAAKETVARLVKDTDNFQLDLKFCVKADGKEFLRENVSEKLDAKNQVVEMYNESLDNNLELFTDYTYRDKEVNIYRLNDNEKYSVYERRPSENDPFITNPFEEDIAKDGEKVLDAFVGSLSEVIQKEELDGKTLYVGNLTETQVPMLVNALTSFVVKYSVLDENTIRTRKLPRIESDVCVRNASGKAVQDENGMITDVMGVLTLVGSDANGNEHEITAEISMSVSEIGTTVIKKPHMTEENSDWYPLERGASGDYFSQKHVGVYKNAIVKADANSLRKVGERILEITEAGDGVCSGNYREIYVDGYTPKEPIGSFTFTKQEAPSDNYLSGEYVLCRFENGETKNMILRLYNGSNSTKIDVCYDVELHKDGYSCVAPEDFDEIFVRVFE